MAEHQQSQFSNIPRPYRQKNLKVPAQQPILMKKSKNSKPIKKMKDFQSQVQIESTVKSSIDYNYRSDLYSKKLKF